MIDKKMPTPMPAWLEKQFENAEKTVASWSDAKREAAGIGANLPLTAGENQE